MKRNIALSVAISLLAFTTTNTALANDCCAPSFFTGFYAGAGIGGQETYGNISSNVFAGQIHSTRFGFPTEVLNLANSDSAHVYKASWLGLLDVGYGYVLGASNIYLGLEAYVSTASRNVNLSNTTTQNDVIPVPPTTFQTAILSTNTKASLNNTEYGIDFRPGYVWCKDTLFYGRVGAAFNQAQIRQTSTLALTYPFSGFTTPVISTVNTSANKHVTGLRLGLGVEQHIICENLTVSLDYVYTDYGSFNTNGIGDVTSIIDNDGTIITNTATGAFTSNANVKLSSNALFLGVKYYIG